MSILKSKLLIRIVSLVLSVLSVIAMPSHTVLDVFTAASNGWNLSYSSEQRAEMITELLLANKRETFETETNKIAREIIYAVIIQFADGNADENAVTDALSKVPHSDKERTENKTYDSVISPDFVKSLMEIAPENLKGAVELLGMGINDLYVYFDDTEYEGIYEFKGSYVDNEGNVHYVDSGAYYDTETGLVYGKNNDGVFGIGYDYDAKQYMLQNPLNCWMRNMGFNIGYDILGKLMFMNTNTVRIKFEALDRNWMIQLWKGNYTILSNGAEIGMYYLEDGKILNYTCIEDEYMPVMEMNLYHGDDKLLERGAMKHWWLSGFQIGNAFESDELTLNSKITFDNAEMCEAFAKALTEKGITPTITDTTVAFSWK